MAPGKEDRDCRGDRDGCDNYEHDSHKTASRPGPFGNRFADIPLCGAFFHECHAIHVLLSDNNFSVEQARRPLSGQAFTFFLGTSLSRDSVVSLGR